MVTEADEDTAANDNQLYTSLPAANQDQQRMVEHQKSNMSALTEQAPSAAAHGMKVGENSNGQVKCVEKNEETLLLVKEEEEAPRFSPSHGLPTHNPNKPSSARPKSGKVLRRKNTPALLPKVEKLYGRFSVSLFECHEHSLGSYHGREGPGITQEKSVESPPFRIKSL